MAMTTNPLIPADGTITITDGAALTYTIVYEDGDFSMTGLMKSQMTLQAFKDRGITYSVRQTEDSNIEFSFSCHAISVLGDGVTATPSDVALKLGVWAAATSKIAVTQGDAYLLQVKWTGERTNFGSTADTTATLKYCSLALDFAEGLPGKLSIKGTCFPISTDFLTLTG